MGSANTIAASNGSKEKYVLFIEPTTTKVGTADTYLYVANDGTSNGTTSASPSAVLEIVVGYIGID